MIGVLEFIFQDFWHWLGTICLLAVIAECGPLIKINIGTKKEEEKIILTPGEGINYTVPNYINPNRMEEKVKIRFRVKKIYEKSAIAVYLDGEKISTRKKRVFAPGEMEEILLKKQDVFDKKNAQKEHTLVIKMEEEG